MKKRKLLESDSDIEKLKRLLDAELTQEEIAYEFGVSRMYLFQTLRRLGIKIDPRDRRATAKRAIKRKLEERTLTMHERIEIVEVEGFPVPIKKCPPGYANGAVPRRNCSGMLSSCHANGRPIWQAPVGF